MNKAVFLDRDGTINEDVGNLWTPEKLIFIDNALTALKLLQQRFLLFIITNQSGISKKVFTEEQYLRFNLYYTALLKEQGIRIERTYHCSHSKEDNCKCRKPQLFYIKKIIDEYHIDLKNSYTVGDHPHDIEMGHRAGTKLIYLLSGHGKKHQNEIALSSDYIANNLYEAAGWILYKEQQKDASLKNTYCGEH